MDRDIGNKRHRRGGDGKTQIQWAVEATNRFISLFFIFGSNFFLNNEEV